MQNAGRRTFAKEKMKRKAKSGRTWKNHRYDIVSVNITLIKEKLLTMQKQLTGEVEVTDDDDTGQ